MALLTELADNISFGIDHIQRQRKHDELAHYDDHTGLDNLSLFLGNVAQHMRTATNDGHKLGLLLIDVERFTNINDTLGRAAGDALLRQVADLLTRNAADSHVVARVGPDTFAIVLPQVTHSG